MEKIKISRKKILLSHCLTCHQRSLKIELQSEEKNLNAVENRLKRNNLSGAAINLVATAETKSQQK